MSSYERFAVLNIDAVGYGALTFKSQELALNRLLETRSIIANHIHLSAGTIIDMVGDQCLARFLTADHAFSAAKAIQLDLAEAIASAPPIPPLAVRIGLSIGPIYAHNGAISGASVVVSERIQSNVAPGSVGIELTAFDELSAPPPSVHCRLRAALIKKDEPPCHFYEYRGDRDFGLAQGRAVAGLTKPTVQFWLVVAKQTEGRQLHAAEMLSWSAFELFNAHGYEVQTLREWKGYGAVDTSQSPYGYDLFLNCNPSAEDSIELSAVAVSREVPSLRASLSVQSLTPRDDQLQGRILSVYALNQLDLFESDLGSRISARLPLGAHQYMAAARRKVGSFTVENFDEGLELLSHALELAPGNGRVLGLLGRTHSIAARFDWRDGRDHHSQLASDYARRALQDETSGVWSMGDNGFVQLWSHDPIGAAKTYDKCMTVLPYHPDMAADAATANCYAGENNTAIAVLERSIRNIPNNADYRMWSLAEVHFALRDYAAVLSTIQRMANQDQVQRLSAATKARLGLDTSPHVKAILQAQPGFSVRTWMQGQPFANQEDHLDYEDALLAAGLPK